MRVMANNHQHDHHPLLPSPIIHRFLTPRQVARETLFSTTPESSRSREQAPTSGSAESEQHAERHAFLAAVRQCPSVVAPSREASARIIRHQGESRVLVMTLLTLRRTW